MSYPVLSMPARLALCGAYSQEIQQKYFLLKIQAVLLGHWCPVFVPWTWSKFLKVFEVTVKF